MDTAVIEQRIVDQLVLEFSHSFDAQIGGQLAGGLMMAGFYEDQWSDEDTPLNSYMSTSMATLSIKPDADWSPAL